MRLAAPPRSALASQDAFAGWVGGEAGVERGVQRLQVGDGDERLGHGRVELRAGAGHDLVDRLLERQRAPVGPVGGHGVEGVAHREDARAEGDLLADQARWVAAPVPALVVRADDLDGGAERLDSGDHLHPHLGVHAHDQPLVVVEQEPVAQAVVGGQVGVDDLCERGGVVMGAVEMGAGGGVLGLDHEGQRLHHVQVRLLELAQRLLQLARPRPLRLVQQVELAREHQKLSLRRFELVQVSSRWIHAGTFPRESRWTTSSRASGEYGLARYASAPAAWAATRSLSRSCSDRMTTLIEASSTSARSARHTSTPSCPDVVRPRIATSGRSDLATSRAAGPSRASSRPYSFRSSRMHSMRRAVASSSATSTRLSAVRARILLTVRVAPPRGGPVAAAAGVLDRTPRALARLVTIGAHFRDLEHFGTVAWRKTAGPGRGTGPAPARSGRLPPATSFTPAVGPRSRFRPGSGEQARRAARRPPAERLFGWPTPAPPHGSGARPPWSARRRRARAAARSSRLKPAAPACYDVCRSARACGFWGWR